MKLFYVGGKLYCFVLWYILWIVILKLKLENSEF